MIGQNAREPEEKKEQERKTSRKEIGKKQVVAEARPTSL
jgi:hypothetical protein